MEIHSVAGAHIEAQIEALKKAQVKQKKVEPYADPLREFSRVSRIEGMVRHWLTYSVEERKRLLKDQFQFIPQMADETDDGFNNRMLERWRGLSVVIQEESRMRFEKGEWVQGSPEVAIGVMKMLFPNHNWKTPALPEK